MSISWEERQGNQKLQEKALVKASRYCLKCSSLVLMENKYIYLIYVRYVVSKNDILSWKKWTRVIPFDTEVGWIHSLGKEHFP